jgi:hypothetical protein
LLTSRPNPDSAIERFDAWLVRRSATLVKDHVYSGPVGGALIWVNGLTGWLDNYLNEWRYAEPLSSYFVLEHCESVF